MNLDIKKEYMEEAIRLAKLGEGRVSPNPMVGAVIVKNGNIIGKGFHEKCGEPHAERNALKNCSESAEGADIYITLEPCCHKGRTPPCVDAIIENKIKRVIYGSKDPNPIVSGKSGAILEDAGIEVIPGFMEKECNKLNPIFFRYITTNLPYVVMKYAMTADGKICTYTGASRWITGMKSLKNVHKTRRKLKGVMVGIGTVLADDPILNCRCEYDPIDPIRIICDSHLRIPLESNILKTSNLIKTYIATISDDEERIKKIEDTGAEVLRTKSLNGRVDLKNLMRILGMCEIDSILLEGGAELNYSALECGIVSKVQAYIAPKLFGGTAKTPVGGKGIAEIEKSIHLRNLHIERFGEDIMLEWEVKECLQA